MAESNIIVEDGSIVDGANAYIDVTFARQFAILRGETIPEEESKIEAFIIQAMDYLEKFEAQFQGKRVIATQSLAFPRTNVVIFGNDFPSDEIPIQLKNTVAQLVVDITQYGSLTPNKTQFAVKRERIEGVMDVQYATPDDGSPLIPKFVKAEGFLKPLLKSVAYKGTYR